MVKSTSNRGRPKAQYKPKLGGDPIIGLMRLKDGRWRASGPEKFTFTEPDEKLAIAHFREWEARQVGSNLGTLKVHRDAFEAMRDLAKRTIDAGGSLCAALE